MKCLVCGRDGAKELCGRHYRARKTIESAYPAWVEAYGGLQWKDYLNRVKRNIQTGQWAKETAELLLGGLDDKTGA